jgi:hypothetical protein
LGVIAATTMSKRWKPAPAPGKALRLLPPRIAVAPQAIDRRAQKGDLALGQCGALVGFGEIGLVRVVARTGAFAVARNGLWMDPVQFGWLDHPLPILTAGETFPAWMPRSTMLLFIPAAWRPVANCKRCGAIGCRHRVATTMRGVWLARGYTRAASCRPDLGQRESPSRGSVLARGSPLRAAGT